MLIERVRAAMRELGVGDHEPVGIACSGGADSVALTHLLARIRRDAVVLHVDHRLRPDSGDDASFVRELASDLGLRCHTSTITVTRRRRGSLEADAREARYGALEQAAAEFDLRWVATAHTLDDQAETVLFRALRGGSLAGVAPVRGFVVRPLLGVRRAELRAWLTEEHLEWREDPTNADERIERNWLRRSVMPLLEQRRPGVAAVLARRAEEVRDDMQALDELADAAFARAETDDAGVYLRTVDLDGLPRALRLRVLRRALRAVGSPARNGEVAAVDALQTGAHVGCSGVTAWRWADGVAVVRESVRPPNELEIAPGRVAISDDWGVRVRMGGAERTPWTWRTFIPADPGTLVLRARRPGDRVRTSVGTRRVQDVLVDAKIPRPLRDFVPLLATEDGSLAVVGLTIRPEPSALAIDVEPAHPTWSRAVVWMERSDSH